jgi:tRNA (cytidine/uridine-2'-O-)-methyltransferase
MSSSPNPNDRRARLRTTGCEERLQIVLVEPEIPPNTGNVARLCAATRAHLHLVHPLGFRTDEKAVRRAGLDYWHLVTVSEHENWGAFEKEVIQERSERFFFFTGKAETSYLDVQYEPGDYLVFGRESTGLSDSILSTYGQHLVGIPTLGEVRSLNLANAVALGAYELLRQTGQLENARLTRTT